MLSLRRCIDPGLFGLAQPFARPRKQFMQAGNSQIANAGQRVGEPCFRVHVFETAGHDDGEDDGGTIGAAL
jgi:hypothetical protein